MKRLCGECTACCKTHPIIRLDKFKGTWCIDCDIGKGCRIYSNRPKECADFECQWLKGYATENDRPDKVNIVVDFCTVEDIEHKILSLWEVTKGALDKRFAENTKQEMLGAGILVLYVYLGNHQTLFITSNITLSKESQQKLSTKTGIKIKYV